MRHQDSAHSHTARTRAPSLMHNTIPLHSHCKKLIKAFQSVFYDQQKRVSFMGSTTPGVEFKVRITLCGWVRAVTFMPCLFIALCARDPRVQTAARNPQYSFTALGSSLGPTDPKCFTQEHVISPILQARRLRHSSDLAKEVPEPG